MGSERAQERTDPVPALRDDFVRARIGNECVVWSPLVAEPTALDALATVMLDVVDGQATMAQLALEVHEEVGVPLEAARRRVKEVVDLYDRAGLLTSSTATATAEQAIAARELFLTSATPCSESASRLATNTLVLDLGGQTIRIACDARRGARMLRAALADHIVDGDDETPLAFVLTAPQGFQRTHQLTDRSGFVLSEGRGLDAGLHALASHLTAFLPPAAGTVRIRARGVVCGGRTIVCATPLLFVPSLSERALTRAGVVLIDRLALDVDVRSGRVTNPPVPWPALAELAPGPAHAGTQPDPNGVPVTAICTLSSGTHAEIAAQLAASGLHGSAADLVAASAALVRHADVRVATTAANEILELLGSFAMEPSDGRAARDV